jgi:hypothetical protein
LSAECTKCSIEWFHYVNRMGYFIAKVPIEGNVRYVILRDDDLASVAKATGGK